MYSHDRKTKIYLFFLSYTFQMFIVSKFVVWDCVVKTFSLRSLVWSVEFRVYCTLLMWDPFLKFQRCCHGYTDSEYHHWLPFKKKQRRKEKNTSRKRRIVSFRSVGFLLMQQQQQQLSYCYFQQKRHLSTCYFSWHLPLARAAFDVHL